MVTTSDVCTAVIVGGVRTGCHGCVECQDHAAAAWFRALELAAEEAEGGLRG